MVKYEVSIVPQGSPCEFDRMWCDEPDAVGDFLCAYINDEYAENPSMSVPREVWRAFGQVGAGIASGGDFSFVFQGEEFTVQVTYATVDDVLSAWAVGERFVPHDQDDLPGDDDVQVQVDRLRVVLPLYATAQARAWRMVVDSAAWEVGFESVYGKYMSEHDVYVNDGMKVTIPCAQGAATFVPVYEEVK